MQRWILVADATQARIFQAAEGKAPLQLMYSLEHPEGRARSQEIGSDEPGRFQKGSGGRHSSMQPHSDPHAVEVDRFVREIASLLRTGFDRRAFEALAMIAPPHFLGLLRAALSTEVGRCLEACVAQDCARIPEQDLQKHIGEALPGWFRKPAPAPKPKAAKTPPRKGRPVSKT